MATMTAAQIATSTDVALLWTTQRAAREAGDDVTVGLVKERMAALGADGTRPPVDQPDIVTGADGKGVALEPGHTPYAPPRDQSGDGGG